MSEIYYKGKKYGGTKSINAEVQQVIVGDGKEWAKGSTFYTNINLIEPAELDDWEPYEEEYIGVPLDRTTNNKIILGANPLKEEEKWNCKLSLSEDGSISIGNNSSTVLDGNTQTFIHDNAIINIDGSTKLRIHDTSEINGSGDGKLYIGGVAQVINSETGESKNVNLNPRVHFEGGFLRVGSKDHIAKITSTGTGIDNYSANPFITFETGEFRFGGQQSSSSYYTPNFAFISGSLLMQEDNNRNPYINLNGGGTFIMNDVGYNGMKTTLSPTLICNPNSFIYVGQGSIGANPVGEDGHPTYDAGIDDSAMTFLSPEALKNSYMRMPRFQIADNSQVVIDASQGAGTTYVKIGSDIGCCVETHILHNAFVEFNNDTIIQMGDSAMVLQEDGRGDGQSPILQMQGPVKFQMISDGATVPELTCRDSANVNFSGNAKVNFTNGTEFISKDGSSVTFSQNAIFDIQSSDVLISGGMDVDLIGGSLKISDASSVNFTGNSSVNIGNGAQINLYDVGVLNILRGGSLNVTNGSSSNITNGSSFNMTNGGIIDVNTSGKISVSNGVIDVNTNGKISISNGAKISMTSETIPAEVDGEEATTVTTVTFGLLEKDSVSFTLEELKKLKGLLTSTTNNTPTEAIVYVDSAPVAFAEPAYETTDLTGLMWELGTMSADNNSFVSSTTRLRISTPYEINGNSKVITIRATANSELLDYAVHFNKSDGSFISNTAWQSGGTLFNVPDNATSIYICLRFSDDKTITTDMLESVILTQYF